MSKKPNISNLSSFGGGYNGWTNYETWNVALWLTNDEDSQNYWRGQARNSESVESLAAQIKQEIDSNFPLIDECSVYADILSAGLSEVDYYEIAQNVRREQHEDTI